MKKLNQLTKKGLTEKQMDLLDPIVVTISDIIENRPPKFSGVCMLIYGTDFDITSRAVDLRPSIQIPKNLYIGTDDLMRYLCDLSQSNNPLHDGYTFFNTSGKLSHVSQFLQVSLSNSLTPHENYGTRFYSSLLATKISGVEIIGNISSDGTGMVFVDGEVYRV